MWPKLTNIQPNIASKIKSYGGSMGASKLNAWIRVFSGAIVSSQNGLVMESNTDYKLFRAVGEDTPVIYGDLQSSGVIGKDWTGNAIETALGRRLRPSPVITSFNVKEGKDQISREANLEIKVFSLEQMEKIQTYFLEPGYSLYVEWGWNTEDGVRNITGYDKNIQSVVSTIAKKSLSWTDLSKTRSSSNGEFDCFLGFIVGGNVSGDSENFNVSVKLRGAPSLPTYMQSHQGTTRLDASGSIAESRKVKELFAPSELEADGVENMTLRRFAKMFNDLPSFRQTTDVYDLKKEAGWYQFINFDESVSKQVNGALSDTWWQSDSIDIGVPGGEKVPIAKEKLFSQKRYIRMDLAVSILNKIGAIDRYEIGGKEVSFKININNTVIGGFPGMFSTKSDKLIIVDTLPDFFQYYLQGEQIEQLSGGIGGCKLKVKGTDYDAIRQNDGLERFRPTKDLNEFGYREDAGYWGYLRNLFVNFDMFHSKIEQKNKNVREIFLDILNELSSAVNSFWNFQIVEGEFKESAAFSGIPTKYNSSKVDGDVEITVIDENFIGQNPLAEPTYFRHVGSGSVFLEASIDISIPSEMTNQIVMTRLGGSSNPDEAIVSTNSNAFFESNGDLFLSAVGAATSKTEDSTEAQESELDTTKKEVESLGIIKESVYIPSGGPSPGSYVYYYYEVDASGKKTGDALRADNPKRIQYVAAESKLTEAQKKDTERKTSNLTAYLDKLTVVPSSKWSIIGITNNSLNTEDELKTALAGTSETSQLKKYFCIYTFDDTEYFDRLKRDAFSKKTRKKDSPTLSHPLPIKYSFKILGNSGIRRGDMFKILGIPAKYAKKGIFQVTQIEHSLDGNQWFTNITGDYRQEQ